VVEANDIDDFGEAGATLPHRRSGTRGCADTLRLLVRYATDSPAAVLSNEINSFCQVV
jgi:hypothetical protein